MLLSLKTVIVRVIGWPLCPIHIINIHVMNVFLTHTHTHRHTHSLSHTHTHTLSHSHTHTHTHTLSLSLSLTHTHTHTHRSPPISPHVFPSDPLIAVEVCCVRFGRPGWYCSQRERERERKAALSHSLARSLRESWGSDLVSAGFAPWLVFLWFNALVYVERMADLTVRVCSSSLSRCLWSYERD